MICQPNKQDAYAAWRGDDEAGTELPLWWAATGVTPALPS